MSRQAIPPPPSEKACEDEWAAAESVRDALLLESDERAPVSDTIPCPPPEEMACRGGMDTETTTAD